MIFIRLHSCICRSTLVHMARIMKLKKYSSLRKKRPYNTRPKSFELKVYSSIILCI